MATVMTQPLRIGILGAARIAPLSIVGPAAATGHRPWPRPSYTCQLEALASAVRNGRAVTTDAGWAVGNA